jgi:hypothetical protein
MDRMVSPERTPPRRRRAVDRGDDDGPLAPEIDLDADPGVLAGGRLLELLRAFGVEEAAVAVVAEGVDHPLGRAVDERPVVDLVGERPLVLDQRPGLLERRELRRSGQRRVGVGGVAEHLELTDADAGTEEGGGGDGGPKPRSAAAST